MLDLQRDGSNVDVPSDARWRGDSSRLSIIDVVGMVEDALNADERIIRLVEIQHSCNNNDVETLFMVAF